MVVIICGGNMKMEIKEIKIGGFRNIKNCVIDIDKITGLLSINKTSLNIVCGEGSLDQPSIKLISFFDKLFIISDTYLKSLE